MGRPAFLMTVDFVEPGCDGHAHRHERLHSSAPAPGNSRLSTSATACCPATSIPRWRASPAPLLRFRGREGPLTTARLLSRHLYVERTAGPAHDRWRRWGPGPDPERLRKIAEFDAAGLHHSGRSGRDTALREAAGVEEVRPMNSRNVGSSLWTHAAPGQCGSRSIPAASSSSSVDRSSDETGRRTATRPARCFRSHVPGRRWRHALGVDASFRQSSEQRSCNRLGAGVEPFTDGLNTGSRVCAGITIVLSTACSVNPKVHRCCSRRASTGQLLPVLPIPSAVPDEPIQ